MTDNLRHISGGEARDEYGFSMDPEIRSAAWQSLCSLAGMDPDSTDITLDSLIMSVAAMIRTAEQDGPWPDETEP